MAWSRNSVRSSEFSAYVKRLVLKRDAICVLCHVNASTEVDHIVPVTISHDSSMANARGVCSPCHRAKSLDEARVARRAQAARRYMPKAKHPGDL